MAKSFRSVLDSKFRNIFTTNFVRHDASLISKPLTVTFYFCKSSEIFVADSTSFICLPRASMCIFVYFEVYGTHTVNFVLKN